MSWMCDQVKVGHTCAGIIGVTPMKGIIMQIAKNTVVTVDYKLSDAQGELIEEGREPMVYLHGGYENTLPKIEEALDGKNVGYENTIQVEPEDAFGDYDPEL